MVCSKLKELSVKNLVSNTMLTLRVPSFHFGDNQLSKLVVIRTNKQSWLHKLQF
jgi:hypothetical protein